MRAQRMTKLQSCDEDASGLQTMDVPRPITFEAADVPDLVLLYATQVYDGAVPNGYLEPFLSLENQLYSAARRVDRRNAAQMFQPLNSSTVSSKGRKTNDVTNALQLTSL